MLMAKAEEFLHAYPRYAFLMHDTAGAKADQGIQIA